MFALTYINRREKVIKNSQIIFIYIFIAGATMLNLIILSYVGPNNDTTCMLRPWLFDISSTIMFAPLLMKLHRVDRLVNNPKLKKLKITNTQVLMQVVGLVGIDVIILILWSVIDTPRQLTQKSTYASVQAKVEDETCSTGFQSPFEIIMLIYKILLLAFGVYKVISPVFIVVAIVLTLAWAVCTCRL
jgi:hypothetical protein